MQIRALLLHFSHYPYNYFKYKNIELTSVKQKLSFLEGVIQI